MKNKIYISEPGIICSAGTSLQDAWKNILSGNQSGIKKVLTSTGEEFFAARVDDEKLSSSKGRYDMRIIKLENAALEQIRAAVEKAVEMFGKKRIGVCVGSCDNGSEFSVESHKVFFNTNSFPQNYNLEIQSADYPATFVKEKFSLEGPALAFSTACSSSAAAIIKAAQLIESNICDAVIAGGADVASDTVLLGFNSLEAVSNEITNPFSANRKGITLGEGASFFVLSKDRICSDGIFLAGYGESADAYHMTSPDPEGTGAETAMKNALLKSEISCSEIGYVNLHGTGTRLNDSMEAKAVSRIFSSFKVPCSTTKAVTGHTLGTAAAIEAAVCYMALKTQELPVQVWDKIFDKEIPELNFIDNELSKNNLNKINYALSNSFAFGGSNASLVLGRDCFE